MSSNSKSAMLVNKLSKIRGYRCENCHQDTWLDGKIPLCVHHIDGNHRNNDESNLQLLCPNCHSLTDNYCGRNKSNKKKYTDDLYLNALMDSSSIREALFKMGIYYSSKNHYEKCYDLIDQYDIKHLKPKTRNKNYCIDCGVEINESAKRCVACNSIYSRKVKRPTKEELEELLVNNNFCQLGRMFGVSDNAIRKWCKAYGIVI